MMNQQDSTEMFMGTQKSLRAQTATMRSASKKIVQQPTQFPGGAELQSQKKRIESAHQESQKIIKRVDSSKPDRPQFSKSAK